MEHLFTQCPFTVTLYNQIKKWCKNYDINLPSLEREAIIYGVIPCNSKNVIINLCITLFKKIVFMVGITNKLFLCPLI